MGDTGYGNFENDAAADFVADLLDSLLAKIAAIADSQHGMEPDESSCREMVAAVDLVHTIARHTGACLPERTRFQGWKDSFFNAWAEFFETSPEYRNVKRIAVVRRTFDRVISYCEQFDDLDAHEED